MPPAKLEYLSKSSLTLQILIFFNGVYQVLFFLATLGIYIWKGVTLPYPNNKLGPEVFLLFAYELVETTRLFIGSKGNKTENVPNLIAFIVLSLFGILANIYFLDFQVYVLRIDLILNVVAIVFVGLELFLAAIAAFRFTTDWPYLMLAAQEGFDPIQSIFENLLESGPTEYAADEDKNTQPDW